MSDYAIAIKHREAILKRFATNPPAEWSKKYLALNVKHIQDQITRFKELASRGK